MNNHIGKRFGKLVAIGRVAKKVKSQFVTFYLCHCECGNYKLIRDGSLNNGVTKSCGCMHKEGVKNRMTKHGMRYEPLYHVWHGMIDRCVNKKCKGYKYYGGRGISVCIEWLSDISCFIKWCKSNGWKKGLDIDRINNNGNYSPGNCRFVTKKINSRNKRNNRLLIYKGNEYCMADLADKYNISYKNLSERIYRGWSVKDAVEIPVKKYRRRVKEECFNV